MYKVSATELQKNIGEFMDKALQEPVCVTKHSRESIVLVSAERYKQMEDMIAKSMFVHEAPEHVIDLIKDAEYGK